MAEIDTLIGSRAVGVVLLSDCCFAVPQSWPELIDRGRIAEAALPAGGRGEPPWGPVGKTDAARIFVGNTAYVFEGFRFERQAGDHALLAFVVAQGLSGEADIETPCAFDETTGYRPDRYRLPDGYVSLRELLSFINRNRSEFLALGMRPVEFRGRLGRGDVVLTRHRLPLD
jgi:hypothetical protein